MFGFIFGAACLAGLYALHRPRAYARGCAHHHDHYDHHEDRGRHRRKHRRGRFVAWRIDRALRGIDATPNQKDAVRDAAVALRDDVVAMRDTLRDQRQDLAALLADESLDAERVSAAFARQSDALETLQGAIKRTLDELHAVLDADQRRALVEALGVSPTPRADTAEGPYR